MIPRYIATLALVVLIVTAACSSLSFATNSRVVSGQAVEETMQFEFTIGADLDHTYDLTPKLKQFLEDHVKFDGEGAARVISSKIEVTPQERVLDQGPHQIHLPRSWHDRRCAVRHSR